MGKTTFCAIKLSLIWETEAAAKTHKENKLAVFKVLWIGLRTYYRRTNSGTYKIKKSLKNLWRKEILISRVEEGCTDHV